MNSQSGILVLIYYRFRGRMQPIRNLLCYLQMPFVEIHLDFLDEQRKILPSYIFQKLKGLQIEIPMLPLLVHDDLLIYESFSIMNYICRISMRQDLLGVSIYEKAQVVQILQIYYRKQPQSMAQLFRVSDLAANSTKQVINNSLITSFEFLINSSGYIKQICNYINKRKKPKYVFDNITIVDFLFLETCIYMLGGFNNLDQVQNKKKLKQQNCTYLSIMRSFKNRMQNQPFYILNQDYLQNFSIVSVKTSPQRIKGLRNFWIGNPKFIRS